MYQRIQRLNGRPEPLRELPWQTDDGKPAFTTYGNGRLNSLADAHEETLLAVARQDAIRARELVRAPATTSAELSLALRTLVHAVRSATHVADLRGHRLDDLALLRAFQGDNEQ
ncbi:hypothetical protein [Streptomyces sp. CO7]